MGEALGFWHERRRWNRDKQAQCAARVAICARLYNLELDAGLPAGWRRRIAAELGIKVTTVSRYLAKLRAEERGRPCLRCGCPGHPHP